MLTPKTLNYWTKTRRLSLATARKLGVGYFGRSEFSKYDHRLMFPVLDLTGQVITYQGRALDDVDDPNTVWTPDRPKFWHSSEGSTFKKKELLCGLYENGEDIVRQGFAVISEGHFDMASVMEVGCAGVCTLGTSLSEIHCFQLKQFTGRVVTWFDDDEAGQKATERATRLLKAWGFFVKNIREGLHDANTLLVQSGKNKVRDVILS